MSAPLNHKVPITIIVVLKEVAFHVVFNGKMGYYIILSDFLTS